MTDNPLLSCRVKFSRAHEHFLNLERTINALGTEGNKPHEILTEDQADGFTRIYRLRVVKDTSDLSALLGDTVHNLRSALDSLAVVLLKPEFRTDGIIKDTYFPIREEGPKYSTRDQQFFGRIGDQAAEIIVQMVQPHKGGAGANLCTLNKLSRIDRHRSIVAVNAPFNQAVLFGQQTERGTYIAADRSGLKDGGEIGRWICRDRPNDYPSAQFTFAVLIKERDIPEEPILRVLVNCRDATERAINILARDALGLDW